MNEIIIGKSVIFINDEKIQSESDHWCKLDNLKLNNEYIIKDFDICNSKYFIMVKNHNFYHPIERFKLIQNE